MSELPPPTPSWRLKTFNSSLSQEAVTPGPHLLRSRAHEQSWPGSGRPFYFSLDSWFELGFGVGESVFTVWGRVKQASRAELYEGTFLGEHSCH